MIKDKVSIIVPVYKSEKYLKACLDSILAQSYSNIEVVIIDDGSPDGCPEICNAYLTTDKRCVVVHKKNGGVSSARNEGLKKATGDYIVFVDSDDTLPSDSIERLYKAIADSHSQYAAGAISNGKKTYPCFNSTIDFNNEAPDLLQYLTAAGSYSPYAKIFITSIIQENNLYYNENLKCAEDALFIRQYLKYCRRIRLIPETVYYYNTQNTNSLSKKFYPEYSSYYMEKLKALDALMEKLKLTEEQKKSFIKERAVHGLKISTKHYLLCEQYDALAKYIRITIENFSPWLSMDANIKNKSLNNWWKKHSQQVESASVDEYIQSVLKEEKRSLTVVKTKKFIRKILGM